ncbi:GAF domain-containing protein [Skermanella sp. TT6]|uniref:histidine kinase n=1 Tax=Skermanella cutis TaxID=2775420 RepID=A0ABX7B6F9_9PROT|nr:HWE histidine kinase domain-containing protein [Skermanella sp. TT6]QQP89931.1 GAF domain-containing protein [Skermanella sp. TT6]
MIVSSPSFGAVDLTNCDREPIEIPGSIQPHGVLVVLHPETLCILQAAGPTETLLGSTPGELAGIPFGSLVNADAIGVIRDVVARANLIPRSKNLFSLELAAADRRFDASVHAGEAGLVVELEPVDGSSPLPPGGPLGLVQAMLGAVQGAATLRDFCRGAAEEVRRATGFARVMIYRFNQDGIGHVFAESRRDDIGSYLDLHYPASDIPAQARDLYRRNWLRLIPDARYRPAPLVPPVSPLTGRPVNLAHCALRSVSPLHLEYLANMNVRASMSLSILRGDRLWGLVACHHDEPRYLPHGTRAACELFAQMFSFQLDARLKAEMLEEAMRLHGVHDRLVGVISRDDDLAGGLMCHKPNLQDYVPCSGVALWLDGRFSSIGTTPDQATVKDLVDWLDRSSPDGVWETDRLSQVWPGGDGIREIAAGVLALSVSRSPRDYILWFRPEVVRTVTWAGNPNKPVEATSAGDRLSPRRSFEAWREEVRGRSHPWSEAEIAAARTLRTTLLEVVLRRVDQIAKERETARRSQELLLAELDHRVKNTLANIQALVQYSASGHRGSSTALEDFTASFGQRLRAMAYAHSLLTRSRWEGADLRSLLEEEMRAHQDPRAAGRLRLDGPAILLRPKAALALSMAVHELVTNAAKYGSLSTPSGTVTVRWALDGPAEARVFTLDWTERGGPAVTPPDRSGFGRIVIERSLAYEVDGTSRLDFEPEGVRCRIGIPEEHVIDVTPPPAPPEAGPCDPAPAASRRPRRVLLVEDSALVAMQVEHMLLAAGCEVVGPAARVAAALKLAREEPIDAAVVDIDLHGTPSWDVADVLAGRGIPFLLATGFSSDDALPERFRHVRRLFKPYSSGDFAEALDTLIGRAAYPA